MGGEGRGEENADVKGKRSRPFPAADSQTRSGASPVTINLIHARGSVPTPVLNAVVHVQAAGRPRPAGRTDTSVAARIIQHAASAVVTRLLIEGEP